MTPAASQSRPHQLMHRIFGPVPAMVFAGLFLCVTCLSIYQQTALRRATAPQSVTTETLYPQESRRGPGKPITPSSNGYFEVRAIYLPVARLSDYTAEIVNAAGKREFSIPLTDPADLEAKDVQLRLHAGTLHSGKYNLLITATDQAGGGRTTLGTYPFELKLQD